MKCPEVNRRGGEVSGANCPGVSFHVAKGKGGVEDQAVAEREMRKKGEKGKWCGSYGLLQACQRLRIRACDGKEGNGGKR